MTNRSHMAAELFATPGVLRDNAQGWQEQATRLRSQFSDRPHIVLVGRGSSGNAVTFATYLGALRAGRQPVEFRPWIATQECGDASWSDAVAFAFSASGQSTDIIHSARWLMGRQAYVVGVTNSDDPNCTLRLAADDVFLLHAGREVAVPATKSFTAQLFAAAALLGEDVTVPSTQCALAMDAVVERTDVPELAEFLAEASNIVFVSRGMALAAALDAALKFRETTGIPCSAFSTAEFLHGPVGAVRPSDRVVLFLGTDEMESAQAVVTQLVARNVPYRILAPDAGHNDRPAVRFAVPDARWARTPLFAFVSQLLCLRVSELLGIDPDEPRGLSKVTLT